MFERLYYTVEGEVDDLPGVMGVKMGVDCVSC